MSLQYNENVKKGKNCKCFCNRCKFATKHIIISDIQDKGFDNEDGISWNDDYQIIKCDNCNTISFRKDAWLSENQDEDNDGSYEELYPDSEENVRKEQVYKALPFSLSEIYREVIIAYNKNLVLLAAVGIRTILEGICKDKKVYKGLVPNEDGKEHNRKSLEGKIYGLLQNGLISETQTSALHELRFLGNNAVHDLEEPSREELKTALDIIEHMIDDLYELPLKSKKLKQQREAR